MNNLQMNQHPQQMNQTSQMNQLQNQQMNNNISNHIMNNQLANNQLANNQMANNQMANNVYELEEDYKESSYKNIASTVNYVLIVLLAIALNDLAKFYINRAIKFQNGNHKYYLYYVFVHY